MAKSTSITWWPAQEQKSAVEALNWHHQRGQAENFNKKLKWGFGMEQMPYGWSFANAVFFRIGVIEYNLFYRFQAPLRPPVLGNPEHRHVSLEDAAGWIVRHGGQLVLKLCVNAGKSALLEAIGWKSNNVEILQRGDRGLWVR